MRRTLPLLAIAACGSSDAMPDAEVPCVPDATHRCVTWTWSFVDHASGEAIACPPEVTSMHLVAEFHQFFDSSEITENRGEATANCAQGTKTFLVEGGNRTRLEALEGSRVYARDERSLSDGDEFAASFANRRGYIQIAWTITKSTDGRTLTCFEASQVSIIPFWSLKTTNVADANDVVRDQLVCKDGVAVTSSGRHPGSYQVHLGGRGPNGAERASVDVGPIEVI